MRFGVPGYFNLLWCLIPLIFFMVWGMRKKHQLTQKFCGNLLLSRLVHPGVEKRHQSKTIFIVLAVFFLIFSLTQPRWGYHWEDLHQRGLQPVGYSAVGWQPQGLQGQLQGVEACWQHRVAAVHAGEEPDRAGHH